MFRSVVLIALLLALTTSLGTALVTRESVGTSEYIVGAALLGALVLSMFRVARAALRRA
jgi:hypothetical protein